MGKMIWVIRLFCLLAALYLGQFAVRVGVLGLANSGAHRWMSLGLAFNATASSLVAIWISTMGVDWKRRK